VFSGTGDASLIVIFRWASRDTAVVNRRTSATARAPGVIFFMVVIFYLAPRILC